MHLITGVNKIMFFPLSDIKMTSSTACGNKTHLLSKIPL